MSKGGGNGGEATSDKAGEPVTTVQVSTFVRVKQLNIFEERPLHCKHDTMCIATKTNEMTGSRNISSHVFGNQNRSLLIT